MGQYHSIYNKTKKEMLTPHSFGCGTKLLEFTSSYALMSGLAVLLANSNGRGGGDLNPPFRMSPKTYKILPNKGADLKKEMAIAAISGRWAGDEIVIQGDYAEKNDKAFIPENELAEYTDISEIVLKGISTDEYIGQELTKNKWVTKFDLVK